MTYYKDLTPYEYFARHEPIDVKAVNVGWLSIEKPFETGITSQEFKDRLLEFCLDEFVVQIARGFHECEFCDLPYEQRRIERRNNKYGQKAHWASIGDGEIRVIGNSKIYASPTFIYHYVIDHQYKPPDEFVEAVLSGPTPGSKEHQNLLIKYL